MRLLIAFFVLTLTSYAQDGTALPGPLTILPLADQSAPLPMGMLDTQSHYIGLIAPPVVTQIVVSSCTAANPTVCTLANPRPTTIQAGGTATLSGAAGAGCSGLNATHAVSAVSTSTITLTFNATGCTYTANSATLDTHIYWELPAADGTANLPCIQWSAPYVLKFDACGANRYLSNLLSPTAINQSLQFDTDNIYNIGEAPTSTTRIAPANIYVSTMLESPLLRIPYYSGGAIADYFDLVTTTSSLYFKDSSNTTVGLYSNPAGAPFWQFRGHVVADTNLTYDLGSTTDYWRKLYTLDARISTLAGGGTKCVQTNNNGDLSPAAAACGSGGSPPFTDANPILYSAGDATKQLSMTLSGITTGTTRNWTIPNYDMTPAATDHTQTFTANQTFSAHILLGTNNTYDIGTSASRTRAIYAGTNVASPNMRVEYISGGSVLDYFDLQATTSTLYFKDSGGTTVGLYSNPAGTPIWQFRGHAVGDATNTYDLGSTTDYWRKLYATNARINSLAGGGSRCATIDNNGDVGAAACSGGGTVTSVGQTFTGGLISVSGSPVTTSGTLALTVAGTSGGVPYFSSSSTWASSAALTANAPVIGGGAGSAPSVGTRSGNTTAFVTTTGTQTSGNCVSIDASGNHIANGAACPTNPLTTTGDIIYSSSGSTAARLGAPGAGVNWLECCSSGIPFWRNIIASSPLSLSAGVFSCTTCVTTTGGQSISGTTTLSTLSVSTAISGTYNLSGNETVTGNWYARSFSGSGISCSGVADGWLGFDTSGQYLIMCAGGARYRVNLASY